MKQKLALFAALLLSGSALIPADPTRTPVTPTHTIIFHETPAEFARRNGADAPKYWAEWSQYIASVQASGKMVGGSALMPPTPSLTLGNSQALERGPSRASGFLTVSAKSDAEALDMAKGSPAIRTGGAVEVRAHLSMTQNEVSK